MKCTPVLFLGFFFERERFIHSFISHNSHWFMYVVIRNYDSLQYLKANFANAYVLYTQHNMCRCHFLRCWPICMLGTLRQSI